MQETREVSLKMSRMLSQREYEGHEFLPECIQELVKLCPPGAFMINKPTGQLMLIISWFEDGTVRAGVMQELNIHISNAIQDRDYSVFGISPDDLEFYCFMDDDEKLDIWTENLKVARENLIEHHM